MIVMKLASNTFAENELESLGAGGGGWAKLKLISPGCQTASSTKPTMTVVMLLNVFC